MHNQDLILYFGKQVWMFTPLLRTDCPNNSVHTLMARYWQYMLLGVVFTKASRKMAPRCSIVGIVFLTIFYNLPSTCRTKFKHLSCYCLAPGSLLQPYLRKCSCLLFQLGQLPAPQMCLCDSCLVFIQGSRYA